MQYFNDLIVKARAFEYRFKFAVYLRVAFMNLNEAGVFIAQ